MEDDDLVYAIEEFGPEVMAHLFQHGPLHSLVSLALERTAVFQDAVAADVRGHDHNRVFEIHDAALSVGQPPVVQNLQHDVEDVVMGLIDLVEEDHRIGTPPDGLSQLSALFVTDVARRRADQPGNGVPLLVFRHINADHRALVVEEKFGQRPRQLRFADAGRAQKDERADGAVRVFQPRTRADDGFGHRRHGLVLADHAAMQLLFEAEQLLYFAFEQPRHRDASPPADDLGGVLFVDFLFNQAKFALFFRQHLFLGFQPPLELGQFAVAQLGGAVEVVLALGLLDLDAGLFNLLAQASQSLYRMFLSLPLGAERVRLRPHLGKLFFELLQPFARRGVGLLLQRLAFDFELHDATRDFVQPRRHRIDLGSQFRGGLVNQVNRLIGQEPVGDVAAPEHGGGDQRRVLDPNAVMHLVTLLQPAQDRYRVLDRRLLDLDWLETAFERGVLLNVFAVFVERRRADAVQFAAREHRFEQVSGVHRAFGAARADHRVQFVNEEDDFALALLNLFQHGLQTFFEFSAVLRAGDKRAHVESDDLFAFQTFGHVAAHDALGQPLDNGGFADARFADQYRIVFGSAREHLYRPADLVVAADDGIELALFGEPRQVAAVALQRLVSRLRVLRRDALAAAHLLQRPHQSLARDAGFV